MAASWSRASAHDPVMCCRTTPSPRHFRELCPRHGGLAAPAPGDGAECVHTPRTGDTDSLLPWAREEVFCSRRTTSKAPRRRTGPGGGLDARVDRTLALEHQGRYYLLDQLHAAARSSTSYPQASELRREHIHDAGKAQQ